MSEGSVACIDAAAIFEFLSSLGSRLVLAEVSDEASGRSRRRTRMRYFALAADYDGTLATSGSLSEEVEVALERLRSSGRRAVLVTGRTFEELASHRPSMELFDCVVLENGGVLYSPGETSDDRALPTRLTGTGSRPRTAWSRAGPHGAGDLGDQATPRGPGSGGDSRPGP